MKISDIEVILLRQKEAIQAIGDSTQDAVIIKVHTDEGITGIGEVASSPYVVEAIVNAPLSKYLCCGLKQICLGKDPLEIEKIWQEMYEQSSWFGLRGAGIHAMSGIDMALWDIKGKYLGQPVYKLLGGAFHQKIRAYASTLFPDNAKEIAPIVHNYVQQGFTAIKFGWGKFGQILQDDIQMVQEARKASGENILLMIDAGGNYKDVTLALQQAKNLEKYNVYFFEEPFPPDELSALAKLAQSSPIRIATGERYSTRYQFEDLILKGKVDIIQPDVGRVGGISEFMKVAFIAQQHNIPCIPHAWSSDVLLASTLHVNAVIPNGGILQEFCVSEKPLRKELAKEPIQQKNGYITIPKKPGLGIELNEETVETFRIK
ncbi:mandelate racemase/muconate lactonizing enzyme family protein [bacterium]|nr:mandelate racemase/muconate lactonizing enzyme family protein [bacterium]